MGLCISKEQTDSVKDEYEAALAAFYKKVNCDPAVELVPIANDPAHKLWTVATVDDIPTGDKADGKNKVEKSKYRSHSVVYVI